MFSTWKHHTVQRPESRITAEVQAMNKMAWNVFDFPFLWFSRATTFAQSYHFILSFISQSIWQELTPLYGQTWENREVKKKSKGNLTKAFLFSLNLIFFTLLQRSIFPMPSDKGIYLCHINYIYLLLLLHYHYWNHMEIVIQAQKGKNLKVKTSSHSSFSSEATIFVPFLILDGPWLTP